jgi:hypothetical protein
VAGKIRSTENSNDLIGNRTRDLPAYSIVPQQTLNYYYYYCHYINCLILYCVCKLFVVSLCVLVLNL